MKRAALELIVFAAMLLVLAADAFVLAIVCPPILQALR
jgi:hypothetical protein